MVSVFPFVEMMYHIDLCVLNYPCNRTSLVAQMVVSIYNAGDLDSVPGSGRLPGEGNGNPLQYSCLENPMDGGAWCRLLSMGSQSRTQLSNFPLSM